VVLQDDGLSDASSVTENQLHPPALHVSFARFGPHEPARDGGVLGGGVSGRPQQQPDPAAVFRGELQPPGLDAAQPAALSAPRRRRQRRDDGGHAAAAQALGQRPQVVGGAVGVEQQQPLQRHAERRQGRRVKLVARVGPDDGGGRSGRGDKGARGHAGRTPVVFCPLVP
jgi:hypothetical protein